MDSRNLSQADRHVLYGLLLKKKRSPAEERKLKTPAYQTRIAKAVAAGIEAYLRKRPPPGTLLAALGATPVSILPPIMLSLGYSAFVAVLYPLFLW